MLHVLICDDDPNHRANMEAIITKHIATEDVKMELIVSASGPEEVLEYLEKHPDKHGLYFLDVDLQHEIDGITLGAKIRETDPLAKIVFVTTHEELAYLTFRQKVEAMDYIVKNCPEDVETRTRECVLGAYKRYMQKKDAEPKYFMINTHGTLQKIPHDDILFFETHPRISERMILHMEDKEIDFRGIISKIESLVPEFYRCHKSFLVNPRQIVRVDKVTKEAIMVDGSRVHVAAKKASELVGMLGEMK